MSEVTPDALAGMQRQMTELAEAVRELKEASTPKEKQEAKKDVDEASSALEAYARAHGVSVEDAEEAINKIKRDHRKSEMREILEEIFQEDEAAAAAEEEKKKAEKEAEAAGEKEKEKPAKPKEKVADAVPAGPGHWTDRSLFGGNGNGD